MVEYWVGVDGGGPHSRARIRDRAGKLLGEGRAAGSNLGLGIELARALLAMPFRSANVRLTSDAFGACLGAFGGREGTMQFAQLEESPWLHS